MKQDLERILHVQPPTRTKPQRIRLGDITESICKYTMIALASIPLLIGTLKATTYAIDRMPVVKYALQHGKCPYELAVEEDLKEVWGEKFNRTVRIVLGDENPDVNDRTYLIPTYKGGL